MTSGILTLSDNSLPPQAGEYGLSTFTTMALSLPHWHQHPPYRNALGNAHARRLHNACAALGYTFPWPDTQHCIDELTHHLRDLPNTDNTPWHRVRIGLIPQSSGLSAWLAIEPLASGPDMLKPACDVYGLVLPRAQAGIKHTDYRAEHAAITEHSPKGWDDIIRLSPHGALLEGSVSALVLFMPDGSLISPDPRTNACLNSLTLQHLMTHCPEFNWQLCTITVNDLQHTAPVGAFLVNAVRGIMPIQRLSLASYQNGPEWTFDPSTLQTKLTRLAQALRPDGYHLGTGY